MCLLVKNPITILHTQCYILIFTHQGPLGNVGDLSVPWDGRRVEDSLEANTEPAPGTIRVSTNLSCSDPSDEAGVVLQSCSLSPSIKIRRLLLSTILMVGRVRTIGQMFYLLFSDIDTTADTAESSRLYTFH